MNKTTILRKILTGSVSFEDLVQLPDETLATIAGIDLNSIKTATDAELIKIAYPEKAEGKKS